VENLHGSTCHYGLTAFSICDNNPPQIHLLLLNSRKIKRFLKSPMCLLKDEPLGKHAYQNKVFTIFEPRIERFIEHTRSFHHRFLQNHRFMIKITEHTSVLQRFGNLQLKIYLHGKANQLLPDKCMCSTSHAISDKRMLKNATRQLCRLDLDTSGKVVTI